MGRYSVPLPPGPLLDTLSQCSRANRLFMRPLARAPSRSVENFEISVFLILFLKYIDNEESSHFRKLIKR